MSVHDHVDWDLNTKVADDAHALLMEMVEALPRGRTCRHCLRAGGAMSQLATLRATAANLPEHAAGMLPIIQLAEERVQEAIAGLTEHSDLPFPKTRDPGRVTKW